MDRFDYIIAGGGCAGLSLAYRLIHSPLGGQSILVIDRDDKDQNDRTWAFWTRSRNPLQAIVHREWSHLRFMGDGSDRVLPLGEWRYVMIRGDDFYRHIRGLLATRPNVTWVKAPISHIEDGANGATVRTNGSAYRGTWVFDSLFNINDFSPDTTRHRYLQQHYKGWFIETAADVFDPSSALLFDFRTPQAGEMRFFYLLPTSPREALVEYVGLSLTEFDELLDRYVREVWGIGEYRVVSDEVGITPQTDHRFPRRKGAHVMAVGIEGGLVKPTSGYAYTRIQDDSEHIVRSLLAHGHPFDVPSTAGLYRWLDSVMLELMRVEPERLQSVFDAMFRRNPAPRIFRFLDERATPGDILGLVASLPKVPFLRAAARLIPSYIAQSAGRRLLAVEQA